ncbi:MAG: YfhO family protein [Bryobacteraceae bacterium]
MSEMVEMHHTGRARPPWLRRLAIPALLAAITIGFFWRLTLTNQYTWINGPDLARQVLPWFQFQAGELREGRIPLWDPYLFGGQPLLAQAQPGAAYPLNWLLFLAPLRDGWIQLTVLHWYFVAIHFLAVAFAYRLCRDCRFSRASSVAGAVIFGLGGFMGHNDWPQMLNGATWIPLVLLCLLRVARGERPWAAAAAGGLCLGLAFLAGHHQAPIYTALMAAGVWIWIIPRAKDWRRAALMAAAFFVIAGLVSGVQSLLALEYSNNAYRWVDAPAPVGPGDKVPYNVHEKYSLRPDLLLSIVFPNLVGPTDALAGIAALVLALCGVAFAWQRIEVRVAFGVWVGGLLFALGGSVLFHGLLYAILPLLEKARTPAMAAGVAQVGIAVLAAAGLDAIAAMSTEDRRRALTIAVRASAAFGVAVFIAWSAQYLLGRVTADPRTAATGLCALLTAGALAGWSRGAISNLAATAALIGIVLIDLGNGQASYLPHRDAGFRELTKIRNTAPIVEAVRKASAEPGQWGRVDFGSSPDLTYMGSGSPGDFYGIDSFHGYLASLTTTVVDAKLGDEQTRLRYGVRYVVASEPTGGWNELVAQTDEWKLWRNRKAFPRAWIERDGACGGADSVWVLRRESDRMVLWADAACAGRLVVSETVYPGWRAAIDGKASPIGTAHGSLRAVELTAGSHRVEMLYAPASFRWGLAMTLFGILLVPFAGALDARHKL